MSEYTNHPNPLSTDIEKDSEEFGLRVIQAAWEAWKEGNGLGDWSARKKRFDRNRSFAYGRHDTQFAQDAIEVEGLPAQVKLDYSPIKVAVPMIKRLKDRYGPQRLERVEANAIDPFSQTKKEKEKQNALHKLKEAEKIKEVQEFTGVPLEEFNEDDPQDETEVELLYGFNYKTDEEKVMETGVDIIFFDNRWDEVFKDPIQMSIICTGFGAVSCDYDATGRIKFSLIRSENFISSYCEKEDFSDWEYMGRVFNMKISEIRLKHPGKLSEEQLFELAKSHAGKEGNAEWQYNWSQAMASPWESFSVQVVELDYKTLYNLHYEKNTDRFGKEVLDKTRKFKEGKEYQSSPPYYVTYTGLWIVETEFMLQWKLSDCMIKPEKNLVEVHSRYAVFMHDNDKMNNTPLIETMIPDIIALQNIHMQAQKLIATTAPPGYIVDVGRLSDIDLMGDGTMVSPMQLFGIFLQSGMLYYMGTDAGDDIDQSGKQLPPITPNNMTLPAMLPQLDAQFDKHMQRLINVVGSNSLDQGQITNQAVGAKVLNDARQMGEGPTNYMYSAYLAIKNRLAVLANYRLWDILVHGKGGYDGYRQSMGTERIEYIKLEATDDFEKTNFDVKIAVVLNDDEFKQLNLDISTALGEKEITMADAIDCRRLAKINLKYASYLLATRIKRRSKEQSKMRMEETEAAMAGNTAAAEAKAKGEMDVMAFEHKLKMEFQAKELEDFKEREIMKYAGILKNSIATALLAKEGKTEADLPDYLFEGLDLVARTQKEIIAKDIEDNQLAAEEEQAMMEEEAMMAEQEAMQQQGGDPAMMQQQA